MKAELEKLCTGFIANRDELKKAFIFNSGAFFPVCANIFCACGKTADAARLKECSKVIKRHTLPLSRFRGRVRPILSGMLAIGDDAESRMELANQYYRLLKRRFKNTEYLVLAAFLLADLADKELTAEIVARGKEIYRRMNKKHRFLTNNTDSVFAMLLAFSAQTDDDLISGMDTCYQTLKTSFSSSGDVQTASQVLSVSAINPEEKARRVIDLYNALVEAGIKYGHSAELSPLAALSLADAPVSALVEDIVEVDAFLKTQKGYDGKDKDQEERAMHAVMIVSDLYSDMKQVNASVMANTLDMLIAKRKVFYFKVALYAVKFAAEYLVGTKQEPEEKKTETPEETPAEKQAE